MNREEQVKKNLELARRHLEHLISHPEELDSIPDGTHIVLIPTDDLELAEANVKTARKLAKGPKRQRDRSPRPVVSLALA